MKVMVRKAGDQMTIYVAKKDLETPIVSAEKETYWGGTVTLKNGWVLELPDMPADTRLPITVEARKLGEA
jgi:nitrogen fixation protein NifT